jgi:hypothetical protein
MSTNYSFSIPNLPGGMTITCTAATEMELIREAYFWQQLPTYCPIDGTATVFDYRDPKGNKYYGVVSTGYPAFRHPIRQHKDGGGLYTKDEWYFYDGEQETLVWASGKMTPAGQRILAQSKPTSAPATPPVGAGLVPAATPPAPPPPAPPVAAGPAPAVPEESRLDGLIHDLGNLLYGDNSPLSIAALCRRHTEQKRSDLSDLNPDQKGDVLTSLRLRQNLRIKAIERWGEELALANIARNALRLSDGFTDHEAELKDEHIEAMIHGIDVLNNTNPVNRGQA